MISVLALAASRPAGDPFAAAGTIGQLLTGPIGTALAILAVAWFGFGLLAGRISIRRGCLLVLGCFILFGAPAIAHSLLDIAGAAAGAGSTPALAIPVAPPQPTRRPLNYDPYAGAAVPSG
jgi:type IV secretory pathway VirB2 component (pilin)